MNVFIIILQQIVFETLLKRQVMVYGVRLPVSDTGNFLGWTRDQKLTWNADCLIRKERWALLTSRRIISSNWEMKPLMAHWLYVSWWWFVLRLNTELQSGGAQLLRQCSPQQSSENTEYIFFTLHELSLATQV